MKTIAGYISALVAFVGGVILLLNQGKRMFGSTASPHSPTSSNDPIALLVQSAHEPIAQLLMQIVLIVAAARIFGKLFERFRQPPVVGEMLAGIVLGPTIMGTLFPSFSIFVFPEASMINLNLLSQVGIMLFMFVVGMEVGCPSS